MGLCKMSTRSTVSRAQLLTRLHALRTELAAAQQKADECRGFRGEMEGAPYVASISPNLDLACP